MLTKVVQGAEAAPASPGHASPGRGSAPCCDVAFFDEVPHDIRANDKSSEMSDLRIFPPIDVNEAVHSR